MRSSRKPPARPPRARPRRAAVIVQTAVCMTTIMGFAALTVDVGNLYRVRAELQRAADAAALAAAAELGDYSDGNPLARARAIAAQYVSANPVLNQGALIDDSDVMFGRAYIDATERYVFEPTEDAPNAVRVRVRRTSGSPSGPVPLFFAHIFGIKSTNLAAVATAALTPRDIVFVLDLSASHNDDSSLVHYRLTDISNRAVWENLWDGALAPQPVAGGLNSGPTFGNLTDWGAQTTGPDWAFTSDPGLVRLKRGANWGLNAAWASQSLAAWRTAQPPEVQALHPAGYTAAEMSVINSAGGAGLETSTSSSTQKANYRRRALVGLGIYRWKSGKPGGQPGGNGDNIIDAWEVAEIVPYPSAASNPATNSKEIGGNWASFVDYVSDITKSDSATSGFNYRFLLYDPASSYYGNANLRWRFGLKMLVDYVQDQHYIAASSPGLAGSAQQPMGAVSDAVRASFDIIQGLHGNDLVGMAAYGTVGYGPSEKPNDLSWLSDNLDSLKTKVSSFQAGMWTPNTNIAQGIDKGVEVLFNSSGQRKSAAKIMLLLTDGNANQTRAHPTYWDEAQAYQDTLAAAEDARNQPSPRQPVRIYTVSVGADSDIGLMQEVAAIGKGEHFHAAGDVATYKAQLEEIFRKLGGRRPVVLIQ